MDLAEAPKVLIIQDIGVLFKYNYAILSLSWVVYGGMVVVSHHFSEVVFRSQN